MKKTVVGFIALLGIFFLASCGANGASQKTKTFTNEQNGVQMELVFNYEGDEVKKQTANNIMPYSSVGVSTKEEAKQLLDRSPNSIRQSRVSIIRLITEKMQQPNH